MRSELMAALLPMTLPLIAQVSTSPASESALPPTTFGYISAEAAERSPTEGRVLFHEFDFRRRATAEERRFGWARLIRHKDAIEVIAVVAGMQAGRVYQPRIVGWNQPSACKGDTSPDGRASCSQLVDDTSNNPEAEQFHASFRGVVAGASGRAAFRYRLRIGDGLPPLRDPLVRTDRYTNVFWGSHFRGDGLKRPETGEFYLVLVDKGPAQADLEDQLNGPLFGCKSTDLADPSNNCTIWRRAFFGRTARK